jgi:hypothetical protein
MSDQPLKIHRHVTLTVEKPLDKETVKKWFLCVKRNSPSGVLSTHQTVDNDGSPQSVKMVHRENHDGKHLYIVPISRDLSPAEVEKVVSSFVVDNPDLDFDIETNANFSSSLNRPDITSDQSKHLALCNAFAKDKHVSWMKEKADDGWRYGPEFSIENKTHPIMLPWEQLSDTYKKPDLSWPDKLISILNDQGFSVISKENLDNLVSMLKKSI